MMRTHILPCALPRAEADALNRESGRIYSDTLVVQYRVYRRKGVWLSRGASEKLNDSRSPTFLHAHSRDAAQQGFHLACQTAKANRRQGAKYPHRRKFYRTTVWKATGIKREQGRLRLAGAKGLPPIVLHLPDALVSRPPAALL